MVILRDAEAGRVQGRLEGRTSHPSYEKWDERHQQGLREMRGETPIASQRRPGAQASTLVSSVSEMVDRDVNAVVNQAARGRLRFDRSLLQREAKGGAGEAIRQVIEEPGRQEMPVILRVDASS